MLTDDDIRDALEAEFLGEPGNRNLADDLRVARAAIAALREKAAPAVPQGGPVAWVRRHPDGALTSEFLEDAVIEPVRKKSGAWVPLYTTTPTSPVPDVPEGAQINKAS